MDGGSSYLPPPPSAPPPPPAGGWNGSPWVPSRPTLLADGVPPKVKRVAGAVAGVLFAAVAAMWLASFLPSAPTPSWWEAVVVPVFLSIFPLWGLTVLDLARRHGSRRLRGPMPIPLRGWRVPVVIGVGVLSFASFFATFANVGGMGVVASDEPSGSSALQDRPASTSAGLDRSAAAGSRLMASVVMLFTLTAALYLTQDESLAATDEPVVLPPRPAPRAGPWAATTAALGRRTLAADVPGTPDEVLARLGWAVPVRELSRTTITGIAAQAVWSEPARRLGRPMELRFDATIAPLGPGGSRLEATVQPARAWLFPVAVLSAIWGVLIIGVGAAITFAVVPAFGVVWVGFGAFATYANLTVARPPTAAAMGRVEVAARAHGASGPA